MLKACASGLMNLLSCNVNSVRPLNARLLNMPLSSRYMISTEPVMNCVKKACLSPAVGCTSSGNGTTLRSLLSDARHLRKKWLKKASCLLVLKSLHWIKRRTETKPTVRTWVHRTPSVLALKDAGRICQQTYVDTYSKVATAGCIRVNIN